MATFCPSSRKNNFCGLRQLETGKHEEGQDEKVSDNCCNCRSIVSLTASAENKQANKIEPLPQDLEIQLALSALPPHLRDNATVYVLNPD